MENHKIDNGFAYEKSDIMTRVMDDFPAGILLIRADRSIAYANDMFMKLWRVPDELAKYRNDFALMNHVLNQVSDAMGFIKVVERLYASTDSSQDEVAFKDGRVFWRRSYPVLEDDGSMARVWIFADISDVRQSIIDSIQAAGQTLNAQLDQAQTPAASVAAEAEASPEKKRHLFSGFKF